jgi:hypothetical protein
VVSLRKKWNLGLRLNVRHNGPMLNLSLSQQKGTFSSRNSWWTCAGPRLRCLCILDGNFLPARVSLDDWEGRVTIRRPFDIIDNAILQTINKIPFASVQELAKSMCISTATVWWGLTRSLGFVVKHLHWVPHSLTEAQPQIRFDRSIELPRCLEYVQANEWQSILTLDEFWFYLWTSHEIV